MAKISYGHLPIRSTAHQALQELDESAERRAQQLGKMDAPTPGVIGEPELSVLGVAEGSEGYRRLQGMVQAQEQLLDAAAFARGQQKALDSQIGLFDLNRKISRFDKLEAALSNDERRLQLEPSGQAYLKTALDLEGFAVPVERHLNLASKTFGGGTDEAITQVVDRMHTELKGLRGQAHSAVGLGGQAHGDIIVEPSVLKQHTLSTYDVHVPTEPLRWQAHPRFSDLQSATSTTRSVQMQATHAQDGTLQWAATEPVDSAYHLLKDGQQRVLWSSTEPPTIADRFEVEVQDPKLAKRVTPRDWGFEVKLLTGETKAVPAALYGNERVEIDTYPGEPNTLRVHWFEPEDSATGARAEGYEYIDLASGNRYTE